MRRVETTGDASGSYWANRTIGRRKFLRTAVATGGSLTALSLLAACGGGSDEKQAIGFDKADNTTNKAQKGGIYRSFSAVDPQTLDWFVNGNPGIGLISQFAYSPLLQIKPGVMERSEGVLGGCLAESWEVSGDGLTITMKLRQDALWDQRPPTSSRPLDAEDVAYTYKRFAEVGTRRSDLINLASPDAALNGIQVIDKRTVAFKLAYPDGLVLPLLASTGHMNIAPKEAEDKFDMKLDVRGIAPWYITEYRPSASVSYKRNPNWYIKDRPFLDGIEVPIVPDYSNRLSQFKAKNIWSHVANKPDIVQLKKDIPELKLFRGDFTLGWAYLQFGFDPNNPYEDERVRQAFSMAIDRDLFLDTFEDTKSFTDAGIPLEVRWNTALSSGWEGYWVDPKSKEFGPNAKYYQHDLAEAKKLLAAAGKPALETTLSWAIASSVGPSGPQRAEVLAGMLEQLGVKIKRSVVETALFTPNYAQQPERNFVGMAFGSKASSPDPAIQMYYNFHGDSSRRVMKKGADPEQDALIVKMRTEPDLERRRTLIQELQRFMAKRMWALPQPGLSAEVSLSWPFVMNEGVFYPWVSSPSLPAHVYPNLWIDKSKAPA